MFAWIAGNFATIAVCLVLLAIAAAIIARMIRNRKKGVPSCGCHCSGCPNASCHHEK